MNLDPQWTSIKGLLVSIRLYLGFLTAQLGGAGNYIPQVVLNEHGLTLEGALSLYS